MHDSRDSAGATGISPDDAFATLGNEILCDDHDTDAEVCSNCDRRRSVVFSSRCTNCNYETGGGILQGFFAETEFLRFMTAHELNPVNPDSVTEFLSAIANDETVVHSESPLDVEIRLTVDGDTFSGTTDDAVLDAGAAEA